MPTENVTHRGESTVYTTERGGLFTVKVEEGVCLAMGRGECGYTVGEMGLGLVLYPRG